MRALIAGLAILLGGCQTAGPYKRLSDDATTIGTGDGVLIFSSIKAHERATRWDYVIASPATQEVGVLGREFRLPNGFYDLPCGRLGNLIAASLKPGDYMFGPWTINLSVTMPGVGYMVTRSREAHGPIQDRFSFSIRPGAVTYVGEVRVDTAGKLATISDQWECDKTYVHDTWPMLDALPLTKQIGSFSENSATH
jgi:hypothetical protein